MHIKTQYTNILKTKNLKKEQKENNCAELETEPTVFKDFLRNEDEHNTTVY